VRAVHDRSVRSWRHLDVVRVRCRIRCELRRIVCPACGVVAEEVPWARPGARFARAFEDTCVFLARDAPRSCVARLMRVDWQTVGRMIERVVGEHDQNAGDLLDGLRRIGIDEVGYPPLPAVRYRP
jgi:transposase